MYSQHEADLRRNQADYLHRKYGLRPHQNTTDAEANFNTLLEQLRTALPGLPLEIQDAQGNIQSMIGLHLPVNPKS